jgi:oligopeptide/dipeptide ABC transporter ATP-binding protein
VSEPLLEVRDLNVEFPTRSGPVRAVREVDLSVSPGEVFGLVGESGSGKSVFLRTLVRLTPPPGRVRSGEIRFGGRNVLDLGKADLERLRGGDISLIPQDPINGFNPALTVGHQMVRAAKRHRTAAPEHGWDREIEDMLRHVGIEVRGDLKRYPFNFSQGQLQRAMTAMAVLSGKPRLLLADEPTTSLDVTIESQILWLISELQREYGMAVIFVTHDLGVIAQMADRVAVMYAARIVEEAPVKQLFAQPSHPYTIGLLRSAGGFRDRTGKRLYALPGAPPDLTDVREGCPLAPRCHWATDVCREVTPELRRVGDSGTVACHHAEHVAESQV